jgi:hypothetical protein
VLDVVRWEDEDPNAHDSLSMNENVIGTDEAHLKVCQVTTRTHVLENGWTDFLEI